MSVLTEELRLLEMERIKNEINKINFTMPVLTEKLGLEMERIKNEINKMIAIDFRNCRVPMLTGKLWLPEINIPQNLELVLRNNLENQDTYSQICHDYIKCIKNLSNIQTTESRYYFTLLRIYLYLEQFERDLEVKKHELLNYEIKMTDYENLRSALFLEIVIIVPSLTTENPIIVRNDIVIFCEVGKKKTFVGKIVEILENKITVQIKLLDQDMEPSDIEGKKFNIQFKIQHWTLRCYHYALTILSEQNWKSITYPQLYSNYINFEYDIEWINENIKSNKEQRQAVIKVLNKTARPAPYIIFGPPGTGKTATLIEIISQIIRQHSRRNILVCTTSNAAADEIAVRLIDNVPKGFIYRMYATSRSWDSVNEKIRPHSNFVDKTAVYIPKEILSRKIIITTLITSIRLSTMNLRDYFSYIIIDEASQAIEPEILIPLAITNSANEMWKFGSQTQIVIAGDPLQLGPFVCCKRIEHLLGKSMLERLMENCEPYQKLNGKYNPNYITKLIKNYRSHENLIHVSNEEFYEGELECRGGPETKIALNWSMLPNKSFPMIFQQVLGVETRTKNKSVYNSSEILMVIRYVSVLINAKFGERTIRPKDIGIVTPFKRQQIEIAKELAKIDLCDITVGTVETFQGQERTVMIVSTVRSRIFKHDGVEHVGFLSNPKRFNVALTRAKALMIIVGNPKVICINENWKILWEYCKKNQGYIPYEKCPLKPDVTTERVRKASLSIKNNKSNATKSSVRKKGRENKMPNV